MTVAVTGLMIGCSHSTTSPSTVAAVIVSGPAPAIGSTAQLTATASLSDGTTQDVTNVATWESSEPTEAIVSSTGLVTAFAAGTVNITATYQSIMGTDAITIAP
jgi:hypothetical protein